MSADKHVTYIKTFVYVNVGKINRENKAFNSFPAAILASCTHTKHYNGECYILDIWCPFTKGAKRKIFSLAGNDGLP